MRKKQAGIAITLLASIFITVQLTGCANGTFGLGSSVSAVHPAEPASSKNDGNDLKSPISKEIELTMYMIGEAPEGFDTINAELNKRLKKDINATMNFNFISWGDYDRKYPLILSSGEQFDLIYSANWTGYEAQAQKGGFLALDELLPKYAPDLNATLPKIALDQCRIDGRLYMIPSLNVGSLASGFLVRGDILKKYKIAPPENMDQFGAYLDIVKNNVPGLIPYNLAGTRSDIATLTILCQPEDDIWPGGFGLGINILGNRKNPTDIFSLYMTPEYEAFIKTMKVWAEKGYWFKSILSNKVSAADAFKTGASAACITNLTDANAKYLSIMKDHPDWEPQYCPITPDTPCFREVYSGNGVSIGTNAANPERAMLFLDLINTDEAYHDLTFYGIKGVNYALTPDNKIEAVPGNPLYTGEDTSVWGWANPRFTKYSENIMPGYKSIDAADNARAIDSPYAAFVLDTGNIKTEIAALTNVRDQYATPLTAGMVPVDEGLKILRTKLAVAGLDKVLNEVRKQFADYLAKQKN